VDYTDLLAMPRTRETAQAVIDRVMAAIRVQHAELRRLRRRDVATVDEARGGARLAERATVRYITPGGPSAPRRTMVGNDSILFFPIGRVGERRCSPVRRSGSDRRRVSAPAPAERRAGQRRWRADRRRGTRGGRASSPGAPSSATSTWYERQVLSDVTLAQPLQVIAFSGAKPPVWAKPYATRPSHDSFTFQAQTDGQVRLALVAVREADDAVVLVTKQAATAPRLFRRYAPNVLLWTV